jgi:hypothetical protein
VARRQPLCAGRPHDRSRPSFGRDLQQSQEFLALLRRRDDDSEAIEGEDVLVSFVQRQPATRPPPTDEARNRYEHPLVNCGNRAT